MGRGGGAARRQGERAASFDLFSETLEPAWITQALTATGKGTIRRRKLPAVFVIWLVIGMALLRDRSIREVGRHLDLVLPVGRRRQTVSGSAIAQARERLGPAPLEALFAQCAAVWGPTAADAERRGQAPGTGRSPRRPAAQPPALSHAPRSPAHAPGPRHPLPRRGFRPQTLLTSLLDPVAYPAADLIALYHERWELEPGFDDVKTHTLEREEALRSKTPPRIEQERWGLAIGYNLVRLAMAQVAERAGVAPTRISCESPCPAAPPRGAARRTRLQCPSVRRALTNYHRRSGAGRRRASIASSTTPTTSS